MSILDLTTNWALGQVSVGYDAAAVTIVLMSGYGARFPAAPFNATWWNITDYPISAQDPQREIVRVTAGPPTDIFTIIRGQEIAQGGLAASVKNITGKIYMFEAGLTALMMSQINANLGAITPYIQAIVALTTVTITAATHGKGLWPSVTVVDNANPANVIFASVTISLIGDVVITFAVAQTGTVIIK